MLNTNKFESTVAEILRLENHNHNHIVLEYGENNVVVKKIKLSDEDDLQSIDTVVKEFMKAITDSTEVNGHKLTKAVLIDAFIGVVKTYGNVDYKGMLDTIGVVTDMVENGDAEGMIDFIQQTKITNDGIAHSVAYVAHK